MVTNNEVFHTVVYNKQISIVALIAHCQNACLCTITKAEYEIKFQSIQNSDKCFELFCLQNKLKIHFH